MSLRLKDILATLAFVGLLAVNIWVLAVNTRPYCSSYGPNGTLRASNDFELRMNEITCLRDGVDPFDVWAQKIDKPPYYPHSAPKLKDETHTEQINAYTPWEYAILMPFSFLPREIAWQGYRILQILLWAWIVICTYRLAAATVKNRSLTLLVASVPLLLVIPVSFDTNVGNLAIIITASVVGMIFALRSGMDVLAGALWSIAMMKPQCGLLFFVPLLLARKYKTIAVAVFLCLALSIPAVVLSGKSLVELIIQVPNIAVDAFDGCALLPKELYDLLLANLPISSGAILFVPMSLGVAFTCCVCWKTRTDRTWWLPFAMVSLVSVSWTYILGYGYAMCVVPMIVLAVDMAKTPTLGRFLLGVPAILLMARFARGAEIVTGMVFPALAPIAAHLTSLSATIAFALTTAYFIRYFKTDGAHGQSAFCPLWQKG